MSISVDFNFIIYSGLKYGLDPIESMQLARIIGITKNIDIQCVNDALNSLSEKGFISWKSASGPITTPSGLKVFRKEKRDTSELAKKLREMYPPGMKDDKWPWRGTNVTIQAKLDAFYKLFPDITDEEIIKATSDYLGKFIDETGRSLLAYFILKDVGGIKRSILADWVYANRENKQHVIKSNFSQL